MIHRSYHYSNDGSNLMWSTRFSACKDLFNSLVNILLRFLDKLIKIDYVPFVKMSTKKYRKTRRKRVTLGDVKLPISSTIKRYIDLGKGLPRSMIRVEWNGPDLEYESNLKITEYMNENRVVDFVSDEIKTKTIVVDRFQRKPVMVGAMLQEIAAKCPCNYQLIVFKQIGRPERHRILIPLGSLELPENLVYEEAPRDIKLYGQKVAVIFSSEQPIATKFLSLMKSEESIRLFTKDRLPHEVEYSVDKEELELNKIYDLNIT